MSARLQAAVQARVAAGAPGALARIEAPRAGLTWGGSAGYLARGSSRALRPDDAFRTASVTKTVTAAVAVQIAHQGLLALDEPLASQLAPELLHRWRALGALPRTTPRQLLAHTSGLPNYFTDQAFATRLRENPGRTWRPAELVDHAATYGTPRFSPGQGFEYCDTGYVITGILVEQATGQPLHQVYRKLVFDPAAMDSTWLEGYEPARRPEAAHYHTGDLDWTTISPTIDWAGGGLVTTAPDLARFVRSLWSERLIDSRALGELTRWTPTATFPPGHMQRYERYGMGMGANTVEGVELLGHTGFIGAFAFHAPQYDAVLAGTHNDSQVDRWPLVAALCRELRQAA
ncbi:MAG TPA: serine hydrolase domain-containing protein [Streptosporangiaceae bacterium]|nr:serine hydrolase domain-containing protein [Streptosporangiaceae bacterium]